MTGNNRRRHQFGHPKRPTLLAGSLAALAGVSLWITPAFAAPDDVQAQCLEAYTEGQRARKRGALAEAHEALAFCGGTSCPQALHADCLRWLDEVEAATPTSVFRVSDTTGQVLQGVQLSVNGGPRQRLDGRAVTLDPGKHVLLFEAEGYHPLERTFTFSEGEKLVAREVHLKQATSNSGQPVTTAMADETPALPPRPRPSHAPAWIGAGVSAAGFAGFTYFALSARSDDRALEQCIPNCAVSRVEEVEQQYLWANVSLGVGVAGLVGAAAWLLFSPESASTADEASTANLHVYFGQTTRLVGRF